ncbi:MAG: hypothetical protein ACK4J0_01700 [Candidatus Anstonellaceae archaeon]
MSQNKIISEMDELVGFFQRNQEKEFEFKTLQKLLNIQPAILKKLLKILEEGKYLKIKYKINGEYYSWRKNKKIELKTPVQVNDLQVKAEKENKISKEEHYQKIEKLLENLLDKRTHYLKLKEKRQNLLKKGKNFGLLEIYTQQLKELKKEILELAAETKKLIDQLN